MRAKKIGIAAAVAASVTVVALCAGCAQSTEETTPDPEVVTQYLPEVVEQEDGTLIQRTPTEGEVTTVLDTSYTYHMPDGAYPFNTYFLKADEKGCNSCHDDLAQTLNDMEAFAHVDLSNSYGIQITVQMCKDCHTFGYGYQTNQNSFGSLIHGIHDTTEKAECWNCHVGTGSGEGMELWDEKKHSQLRGITPVADVTGDFSYNQDKTTPVDELFDFGWDYFDLDYLRTENTQNDTPLDEGMYNEWTISVSGAVDKEVTYTLPELVEKFASETKPVTFHCTLNPTGGPLLGNAVYTGVPLSKLLEEAGMSTDAGALTFMAPDGFTESVQMDNFTEAYLCYEIDGEKLPWKQGYPVQLIVPHSGAPASVKQVSDIVVNTKEEAASIHEWNGWPKEVDTGDYYTTEGWPFVDENGYQNKPNVALFDFQEGQVIETGKPYTFSGYATAWDKRIAGVEFSMDGGVTWTRFDTPEVNMDNWVIWNFTYTPETDSAYVLSIRSVTDEGDVTEEPIEVLFNAHTK